MVADSEAVRLRSTDDPQCYKRPGYVQQTYGLNPRQEPNLSGRGKRWVDDGGIVAVDEIEWLHAIPNGGRRDGFTAALMKGEGVRRGVLDVHLPLPIPGSFAGLYIEMKKPKVAGSKAGILTEEQHEFIAYGRRVGYAISVCYDWLSASREIIAYVDKYRKAV